MIKHLIAGVAGALTIAAILYMAKLDAEVNRLKMIQEVIAKSSQEVKTTTPKFTQQTSSASSIQQEEESEAEKKLKALKEKAGRLSAFEVSPLYRRNCASCHGVNGEGTSIAPKLIGKSSEYIYEQLMAFKSGKRKNYVMYGLLRNLSEEDLKALAEEIGSFAQKMQAS